MSCAYVIGLVLASFGKLVTNGCELLAGEIMIMTGRKVVGCCRWDEYSTMLIYTRPFDYESFSGTYFLNIAHYHRHNFEFH
jgi:hypothetical protein